MRSSKFEIAPTAEEKRQRLRALAIDLVRKPSAGRLQHEGYIVESERTRRPAFTLSMMVHVFTRRTGGYKSASAFM